MTYEVRPSTDNRLVHWFMTKVGFDGWTSFWSTIYIQPKHIGNERLLRHELEHERQIESEGKVKFAIKYSWYLLMYGYHDNPYEIEARRAE